jgi:hypothetical protein
MGIKNWGGARRRLVCRRSVLNGCGQPVFRPERSLGYMSGIAGIDAASSAQSKWLGTGAEHGGTRLRRGGTGDGGRETVAVGVEQGVDSVVGDEGGVYHMTCGKTARLWLSWAELSGWEAFRGCSDVSSSMFCRSRAAAHGPEWGRAGDLAVVGKRVDDVAVVLGVSG